MTPAAGRGEEIHAAMVTAKLSAPLDARIQSAWCSDCSWRVDGLTYYEAVDRALRHEQHPEPVS